MNVVFNVLDLPVTQLPVCQFVVILDSVLAKLSRYDEGTLFSSFLSFTVRTHSFSRSPLSYRTLHTELDPDLVIILLVIG